MPGFMAEVNFQKLCARRPDAAVVGSPTLTDNFLSVDFNNYIETGVVTTKAATLIAIAHRKAASARQFFITSYKGTGAFGRSLLAEAQVPHR